MKELTCFMDFRPFEGLEEPVGWMSSRRLHAPWLLLPAAYVIRHRLAAVVIDVQLFSTLSTCYYSAY